MSPLTPSSRDEVEAPRTLPEPNDVEVLVEIGAVTVTVFELVSRSVVPSKRSTVTVYVPALEYVRACVTLTIAWVHIEPAEAPTRVAFVPSPQLIT